MRLLYIFAICAAFSITEIQAENVTRDEIDAVPELKSINNIAKSRMTSRVSKEKFDQCVKQMRDTRGPDGKIPTLTSYGLQLKPPETFMSYCTGIAGNR